MDWSSYEAIALADVLEQREDYQYRKICREYSKTFCTPLHSVYKMSFDFVLKNVLENRIESMSEEALRNLAQDFVGADEKEEKLINEQIKQWEKEESSKKKKNKKQDIEIEEKTIDFSDLE